MPPRTSWMLPVLLAHRHHGGKHSPPLLRIHASVICEPSSTGFNTSQLLQCMQVVTQHTPVDDPAGVQVLERERHTRGIEARLRQQQPVPRHLPRTGAPPSLPHGETSSFSCQTLGYMAQQTCNRESQGARRCRRWHARCLRRPIENRRQHPGTRVQCLTQERRWGSASRRRLNSSPPGTYSISRYRRSLSANTVSLRRRGGAPVSEPCAPPFNSGWRDGTASAWRWLLNQLGNRISCPGP